MKRGGNKGLDCTDDSAAHTSGSSVVVLPAPRINLNNLEAVRREMAKVYREMRGQIIPTQDGTRLVYVLGELRKVFEAVDLEKRIAVLEGKHHGNT